MMNRRRFMAITAAVLAAPARAAETVWNGTGFGASLGLRLVGATTTQSAHALRRVKAELSRLDAIFSLHRDSALTRLNRDGRLTFPQVDLLQLLLRQCNQWQSLVVPDNDFLHLCIRHLGPGGKDGHALAQLIDATPVT